MDAPPTLLAADSELGAGYAEAMRLAGRYAYAGMLDVVGFDTATPQLVADFARGAL